MWGSGLRDHHFALLDEWRGVQISGGSMKWDTQLRDCKTIVVKVDRLTQRQK